MFFFRKQLWNNFIKIFIVGLISASLGVGIARWFFLYVNRMIYNKNNNNNVLTIILIAYYFSNFDWIFIGHFRSFSLVDCIETSLEKYNIIIFDENNI
jgi:phosphate/sulfate permease